MSARFHLSYFSVNSRIRENPILRALQRVYSQNQLYAPFNQLILLDFYPESRAIRYFTAHQRVFLYKQQINRHMPTCGCAIVVVALLYL